jgi:MtN3 and saliva related transmembrane protein
MISILFNLLGIAGSLIVCASVITQIIKTYRIKSAHDLSIAYLASLMTGILMLLIYSLYVGDFVFIFGNILSISSVGILMGLWSRYRYRAYGIKGIRLYREVRLWPTRRN